MRYKSTIFCYLVIFISQLISNDQVLSPILFYQKSSSGSDWVYEKNKVTIFGAGITGSFSNANWNINATYIQFGFLGNLDNGLFNFSPSQSFSYIDGSKDADGYWTEYLDTKITYSKNSLTLEFGKFDRHWGFGKRGLHISNKAPSYPQIGINWKINDKLKLIYFHGFLNSGITDSTRSNLYNNNFSKRSMTIPRNIASHRIEWSINDKLKIGANESVIYAIRNIDIHYLIPIAPFYPIENYLGDIDNIQMGLDALYFLNNNSKIHFGFFMDELTPEWIFKKKNHNWFAWQIGFEKKNFIIDNADLFLEYNWTDQRIYKHKYDINDYYSHNIPLGFWAGPHAEEMLIQYNFSFKKNIIQVGTSIVKRGAVGDNLIQGNYQDTYNPRFYEGFEHKIIRYLTFKRKSKLEGLYYTFGINNTDFLNLYLKNVNIDKISLEFGFYYNFFINNK